MPSESASALITAEELEQIDIPGKCTELVRGRLIVREPPGFYHGRIVMTLGSLLWHFIAANNLGVLVTESGFHIEFDPDTVRSPDLAFISHERLADKRLRGFAKVAPDFVVEVISPNDRKSEVLSKVGDWLDAGVKLVWLIDPDREEAHVHRGDGGLSVILRDGTLDGEDVLPGFRQPLADIFGAPRS